MLTNTSLCNIILIMAKHICDPKLSNGCFPGKLKCAVGFVTFSSFLEIEYSSCILHVKSEYSAYKFLFFLLCPFTTSNFNLECTLLNKQRKPFFFSLYSSWFFKNLHFIKDSRWIVTNLNLTENLFNPFSSLPVCFLFHLFLVSQVLTYTWIAVSFKSFQIYPFLWSHSVT